MRKEFTIAGSENSNVAARQLSGWMFGARPVVCLLLVLLSACASMRGGSKPTDEDLMDVAVKFNDAVRWQKFKEAAVFVDPKQQEAFWSTADKLNEKVRMTEYDIRNISREGPTSAVILMRYSYYLLNDPRIKPVTLHQRWQYDEKAKTWKVVQPDMDMLLP